MRPLAQVASNSTNSPRLDEELRQFLSEANEQEVLTIILKHFRHEQHITSDDVRFVVRSVASQGGAVNLPPNFPPLRWILNFKRLHGFSQLSNTLAPVLSDRFNKTCSAVRNAGGSSDDEKSHNESVAPETSAGALISLRSAHSHHERQQQQQHWRQMIIDDHRAMNSSHHCENGGEVEEVGSNTSSSDNGNTTGASSSSSGSSDFAPLSNPEIRNTNEPLQDDASTQIEKRSYKLSHTVPAETWEKAIAAVEQKGMSLRAAAKIYGVHFAALHRRVKKRAQGGKSNKGYSGYFHPSDEAGIVRVVVAHAELGVLMSFDELMKLVETAALRKLPNLSVEDARKLMMRFQSRNEQSIRHIIDDWPPPMLTASSGASNNYLEHPGYNNAIRASTINVQQLIAANALNDTNGSTPLSIQPGASCQTSNYGTSLHILPSLTNRESPLHSRNTIVTSPSTHTLQLLQRVPQSQNPSNPRLLMFV